MSVVGLTFGIAANASRPTTASAAIAATTATTRAGGRSRSYQPKPKASAMPSRTTEAACQLMDEPPPGAPNDQHRGHGRLRAEAPRLGAGSPRPPPGAGPLRA